MARPISTGFTVLDGDPIDDRLTVADEAARKGGGGADAVIFPGSVYEGMIVYQQDTNEIFVYTGGVATDFSDYSMLQDDTNWTKVLEFSDITPPIHHLGPEELIEGTDFTYGLTNPWGGNGSVANVALTSGDDIFDRADIAVGAQIRLQGDFNGDGEATFLTVAITAVNDGSLEFAESDFATQGITGSRVLRRLNVLVESTDDDALRWYVPTLAQRETVQNVADSATLEFEIDSNGTLIGNVIGESIDTSLGNLSDVTIASPTDNDTLVYTDGAWRNLQEQGEAYHHVSVAADANFFNSSAHDVLVTQVGNTINVTFLSDRFGDLAYANNTTYTVRVLGRTVATFTDSDAIQGTETHNGVVYNEVVVNNVTISAHNLAYLIANADDASGATHYFDHNRLTITVEGDNSVNFDGDVYSDDLRLARVEETVSPDEVDVHYPTTFPNEIFPINQNEYYFQPDQAFGRGLYRWRNAPFNIGSQTQLNNARPGNNNAAAAGWIADSIIEFNNLPDLSQANLLAQYPARTQAAVREGDQWGFYYQENGEWVAMHTTATQTLTGNARFGGNTGATLTNATNLANGNTNTVVVGGSTNLQVNSRYGLETTTPDVFIVVLVTAVTATQATLTIEEGGGLVSGGTNFVEFNATATRIVRTLSGRAIEFDGDDVQINSEIITHDGNNNDVITNVQGGQFDGGTLFVKDSNPLYHNQFADVTYSGYTGANTFNEIISFNFGTGNAVLGMYEHNDLLRVIFDFTPAGETETETITRTFVVSRITDTSIEVHSDGINFNQVTQVNFALAGGGTLPAGNGGGVAGAATLQRVVSDDVRLINDGVGISMNVTGNTLDVALDEDITFLQGGYWNAWISGTINEETVTVTGITGQVVRREYTNIRGYGQTWYYFPAATLRIWTRSNALVLSDINDHVSTFNIRRT